MHVIADTHLHLYPGYDIEKAFDAYLSATDKASSQNSAMRIACLAERHDCHFFKEFSEGTRTLNNYRISKTANGSSLLIESTVNQQQFSLIPGRQVISSENIEVLVLNTQEYVEDGQTAAELINTAQKLSAVAVVAWSPGKWFGQRGKVVQSLFDQFKPGDFVLGDTTLRPYGWCTPQLINTGRKLGFQVVAGSDPLPFSGEENWYGAYCSAFETDLNDASAIIASIISHKGIKNSGRRSNPLSLFLRLLGNKKSKNNPMKADA